MRSACILLLLLSTLVCAACAPAAAGCPTPTAAEAARVEMGARAFALSVAEDVTRHGPGAWQRAFADGPSFFMAVNGRLVFPDRAAATAAIQGLARTIQRIELRWGSDLRVDPLTSASAVVACSYHEVRTGTDGSRVEEDGYFTGIAERRGERWQFRDAHWSVAVPTPAVP